MGKMLASLLLFLLSSSSTVLVESQVPWHLHPYGQVWQARVAQEKSSSTGTVPSRFREGYGNFQTLEESWNCSTKGCECTRVIKTCFSDGTERVDEKTSNFGVDEDSSETGVFVESALKAKSL